MSFLLFITGAHMAHLQKRGARAEGFRRLKNLSGFAPTPTGVSPGGGEIVAFPSF